MVITVHIFWFSVDNLAEVEYQISKSDYGKGIDNSLSGAHWYTESLKFNFTYSYIL